MKQKTQTGRQARAYVVIGVILGMLGASLSVQSSVISWSAVKKEIRQKFPGVANISGASLEAWLASPQRTQPRLFDVRTPAEYNVSHLLGATRTLTLKDAMAVLGNADKKTPVVVYCSVGYRSSELAQSLQKNGFSHVSNLEGGIFTWKNDGRPVFKNGHRVQAVHPYSKEWGQLLNP